MNRGTSQVFKVAVVQVNQTVAGNRDIGWRVLKDNILGMAKYLYWLNNLKLVVIFPKLKCIRQRNGVERVLEDDICQRLYLERCDYLSRGLVDLKHIRISSLKLDEHPTPQKPNTIHPRLVMVMPDRAIPEIYPQQPRFSILLKI
jgi:hypothetical protein